ncbi:hypothetical protein P692DRAFT_20405371 [Suillus brevipes Sb2]|nr:hypothetical protein P692DRAFT_20405371 [Suillus brevipes Sb2]
MQLIKHPTLKSIAGMLQSAEFVFPWYHFASYIYYKIYRMQMVFSTRYKRKRTNFIWAVAVIIPAAQAYCCQTYLKFEPCTCMSYCHI